MKLHFKDVSLEVLHAAKKLDQAGFVRISLLAHGRAWRQVADEVIDEIALLNEYSITVKWCEGESCILEKTKEEKGDNSER